MAQKPSPFGLKEKAKKGNKIPSLFIFGKKPLGKFWAKTKPNNL